MHINYTKFSNEELDDIKIEFDAFGYPVNDVEDFCTYKGWLSKGRKVKKGEKGLKIESSHIYSKPLFHCGSPMLDAKTGRQKFYKGTQTFVLFAVQQTEELTKSK